MSEKKTQKIKPNLYYDRGTCFVMCESVKKELLIVKGSKSFEKITEYTEK